MSKCSANVSDCNHHACNIGVNNSVHQTLDELEFERGIWYAAQTGDLPRVTKLLNEGKNVNMVDGAGYTALHYAARNGHLMVCKLLLSYNANINAATRSGCATSLHRACLAGQLKIVELLLQAKADCIIKDSDGKSCLHRAAESQNMQICKLILDACPEQRNEPDNKGKLPVNYAKKEELTAFLR